MHLRTDAHTRSFPVWKVHGLLITEGIGMCNFEPFSPELYCSVSSQRANPGVPTSDVLQKLVP